MYPPAAKVVGVENLLDSFDNKFVRLQMIDPSVVKITLSKIEEDESGLLTYVKVRTIMIEFGFIQ